MNLIKINEKIYNNKILKKELLSEELFYAY